MTNKEIIQIVKDYQANNTYHPLTCGIDSSHILKPVEENDKVILICPTCFYKQYWIPEVILEIKAQEKKAFNKLMEDV